MEVQRENNRIWMISLQIKRMDKHYNNGRKFDLLYNEEHYEMTRRYRGRESGDSPAFCDSAKKRKILKLVINKALYDSYTNIPVGFVSISTVTASPHLSPERHERTEMV